MLGHSKDGCFYESGVLLAGGLINTRALLLGVHIRDLILGDYATVTEQTLVLNPCMTKN